MIALADSKKSKSEEKSHFRRGGKVGSNNHLDLSLKSDLESKFQILKMQAIRALRGKREEDQLAYNDNRR
jgi:hypothetical protein